MCDRDFDIKDANVACRAMGYGSAKSVQTRATYGKGVGKIHYSNLRYVSMVTNIHRCTNLSDVFGGRWDEARGWVLKKFNHLPNANHNTFM